MRPDVTMPRPRPAEPAHARLVFRVAQFRLDRIWASPIQFDLKVEMHLDVLLQVARELDRMARRRELSALTRRVHG